MSKRRMREVETWHGYVETLSSWLALQDESFVRKLQLCAADVAFPTRWLETQSVPPPLAVGKVPLA